LLFDYNPYEYNPSSTIIQSQINGTNEYIYMTITELLLIIFVIIYHSCEIDQFLRTQTSDGKLRTKIKNFFTKDKWNMFDLLLFNTFYIAMIFRLLPIYGQVHLVGKESCYEWARVFYCIDLIFWYMRIIQKFAYITFWGPKIIILKVINFKNL
jgi:hypothetical protein